MRLALDRGLGEELEVERVVSVLEVARLLRGVALERQARAVQLELVCPCQLRY